VQATVASIFRNFTSFEALLRMKLSPVAVRAESNQVTNVATRTFDAMANADRHSLGVSCIRPAIDQRGLMDFQAE
jgi:hypothetical protein